MGHNLMGNLMFDKGGGKKIYIEDAKGVPMGNLVFDGG